MNTAESSAIQEVNRQPARTADVGEAPATAGQYCIRLIKASALVLVGVAVHLWIDGRQSSVRQDTHVSTGQLAARLVDRSGDIASPVIAPLVVHPAATDVPAGHDVSAPRAVATSGYRPVTLTASLVAPAGGPVAASSRPIPASSPPDPVLVRTGALPDLADAALPMMPSSPHLASWTNDPAAASSLPVPPLTADVARASVDSTTAPSPSRAGRIAPAVTRGEEASILEVLHEYETAVGRKDPAAAKAVWPALDDRALARAFNDLQSHSLALEDCGVTVANSNAAARARCQGVATSLPKVGRRKPISASHEWTFNLSKAGGDWQIESAAIR
jgi:hypothetical protein